MLEPLDRYVDDQPEFIRSTHLIPFLHKTDSDLRQADIACLAIAIPSFCILRNSPVHGA